MNSKFKEGFEKIAFKLPKMFKAKTTPKATTGTINKKNEIPVKAPKKNNVKATPLGLHGMK